MTEITISTDQNTVIYFNQKYHFHTSKDTSDAACSCCDLKNNNRACDLAPCMRSERTDKLNGYFIVQNK